MSRNPKLGDQGLVVKFKNLFSSISSKSSARAERRKGSRLISEMEQTNSYTVEEREDSHAIRRMDPSEKQTVGAFYISHASPMLFLLDCPGTQFMRDWQKYTLPEKPKAILVISAHWDTRVPSVSTTIKNSTIYDFYGFPSELYKLTYNAPGAPDLAKRVKELLQQAGWDTVHEDPKRGLDHGAWTPLKLMYPEEDIPCCQLSIQSGNDAAYHFKLGRALASLKQEGVLILGSGSTTHNLSPSTFQEKPRPVWAQAFEDWVDDCVLNGKYEELMDFEKKAPYAKVAHPTPDHFLPLLVAAGAGESAKGEKAHSSFLFSALSMGSYGFKPAAT